MAGGTLANLDCGNGQFKRSHEAIISARSGHILNHEAGAIEATGHKIISIESDDGKLSPKDVQLALDNNAFVPHHVKPKLVYISNATEIGTIYTKPELEALTAICQANNLYLYMDGARLGAALCSPKNDLKLADLSRLTDIFYIGATKNGALLGEAIIINNPILDDYFATIIKQRGALLSKGRLLGIQFLELFKGELYFELASQANSLAQKLSEGLSQKGYNLAAETETNQLFVELPNSLIEQLQTQFAFYVWRPVNADSSVVRLVTSWATDEAKIDAFLGAV